MPNHLLLLSQPLSRCESSSRRIRLSRCLSNISSPCLTLPAGSCFSWGNLWGWSIFQACNGRMPECDLIVCLHGINFPGWDFQACSGWDCKCRRMPESGCDLIVVFLSGRVAWDEPNRVKFDITRVLIRERPQSGTRKTPLFHSGKIFHVPELVGADERGF